jgi:hypothetical protein
VAINKIPIKVTVILTMRIGIVTSVWGDDGRVRARRRILADVEGVFHHPDFYHLVEWILFWW